MKYKMSKAGFLVVILISSNSAFAQQTLGTQNIITSASAPAYYTIGPQGGITIPVNLWGYVKNPGRYEVPSPTDLVQLISYGGGPLGRAELNKVEIIRKVTRGDSTNGTEIIHFNLDRFKKKGGNVPLLLPGDTVIIPGSPNTPIGAVFSVLTPIVYILSGLGTLVLVIRTLH